MTFIRPLTTLDGTLTTLKRSATATLKRSAVRVALVSTAAAALALFAAVEARGPFVASGHGQDFQRLNRFVQTSNSPSVALLREGRDLIDGEQWAKAAEKFDRFLATYPNDKDADVALYWLAYSLKQQGKFKEAAANLSRLLKEFPKSAWADEATAMLTEIAPQTGERRLIDESLNKENEEIKIVALQSLFESNPERGVAYVAEILKPGSTATRTFKEAAVALLGSHGGRQAVPLLLDIARTQPDRELRVTAFRHLADEGGESVTEDLVRLYDSERDAEVKESFLRAFEEMEGQRARAKLLEVARDPAENVELRRTAIRVLGERRDANAFDELTRIYESDARREVKEQIIQSLADMDDPRAQSRLSEIARSPAGDAELRRMAIRRLGERNGDAAVDELMKIFDAEQDLEIKAEALRALGESGNPRARSRVADIARGGVNSELRKTAIRIIADGDEPRAAETLISLYDGEKDADVRADILRVLADTKQKSAVRKLLDVARRDPNVELRKQAIRLLGESDDPEAARYLEELLKP